MAFLSLLEIIIIERMIIYILNKIMSELNKIRTTLFAKISLANIGIIGTLIILIPMFFTALMYSDPSGQMYNPLNHFISELGFVGVSELAWLFNTSIFFGGLFLAFFMWELGKIFQNKLIKISCFLGMLACLFATLIGIFPMNNPEPHIIVAMGFFFSSMFAIILFSIGVYVDKEKIFPKILAFYGLLVFLCFMIFL